MTERKLAARNEWLILGIDPGFGRMGYAVVAAMGNELRLLVCDAIMTPTGQAYPLRLQLIYEELSVIIDPVSPAGGGRGETLLRQECDNGYRGRASSRYCSPHAGAKRTNDCRVHSQ